jgi:predicted ATP-dependent endonuclease of OLD family
MLIFPWKFSIKAANLKCFGQEAQGFEGLERVNVIIGRNNSGKSSLIDLIEYAIRPSTERLGMLGHKNARAEVNLTLPIERKDIEKVFDSGSSGGHIPGPGNHRDYGLKFVGQIINAKIDQNGLAFLPEYNKIFHELPNHIKEERGSLLARNIGNPFQSSKLRKLFAERNIVPELQTASNVVVTETGLGATQIIHEFLNYRHRNRSLVEETLLKALNEIFNPDSNFERITTLLDESSKNWEVYLYETRKGGWIALSNSGSGLKTIILVLVNLILVPVVEAHPSISEYIFAFEELENNLHPALQKRLFEYLYRQAIDKKTCFIFTTHSNVVIDLFANREDAQLLHVKHNGEVATVSKVNSYSSKTAILNDLEFRASDLLQSNGIVWVEGPSDRTYFNQWIKEYSGGSLREGVNYQCIIYGGALKSHLSAEDPDEVERAIAIFNVNRNAIVLNDSDRQTSRSRLKKTVIRLRTELEGRERAMCFISEGREIENYLPIEAVNQAFGKENIRSINKFEKADDYISYLRLVTGQKTLNKLSLAEKLAPYIKRSQLDQTHNLKSSMRKIISIIESWNLAEMPR